jgi:midasin
MLGNFYPEEILMMQTIDPVLNPTLTTAGEDDIFRAILITLRIQAAQGRLQHWLEANGSTKAVLAQSAASNAGRKSKRVAPGAHVYSLLVEMRTILKDSLRSINPVSRP